MALFAIFKPAGPAFGRWPWGVSLWVGGLAVGLAGCASLAPPVDPAPLPVPAEYPGGASQAVGVSAATVDWRDFYTDPPLQALMAQALAHNADLRLAVLRVREAQAAHGIQRAERLPAVGLGLDAARARVPGDLNVSGKPVVGSDNELALGVSSWELDFWGRVRHLSDAALANYLATDAARRATQLALVAQVANAYLGLRELDERLALAQRTVDSRAQSLQIFRRRVELGATSRLELTQVELLWQQASALVAQLAHARTQQANALALLVGQPVAAAPSAQRLEDMAAWRDLPPGLPSDLLLNRPDIVAAEQALKAAHAHIGAARAAFFPRITLNGSLGTASAELDGLFDAGSLVWTFVPRVSLPIFDGGRRQLALDLAELRREQAVVRYEQAVQAAFRDVADALSARQRLGEQVAVLRATQGVQAERARLAKLRYDSGAARYLEVLDAERDLLNVAQQLVQTQRAWMGAHVALYTALGGGSLTLAAAAAVTE